MIYLFEDNRDVRKVDLSTKEGLNAIQEFLNAGSYAVLFSMEKKRQKHKKYLVHVCAKKHNVEVDVHKTVHLHPARIESWCTVYSSEATVYTLDGKDLAISDIMTTGRYRIYSSIPMFFERSDYAICRINEEMKPSTLYNRIERVDRKWRHDHKEEWAMASESRDYKGYNTKRDAALAPALEKSSEITGTVRRVANRFSEMLQA